MGDYLDDPIDLDDDGDSDEPVWPVGVAFLVAIFASIYLWVQILTLIF